MLSRERKKPDEVKGGWRGKKVERQKKNAEVSRRGGRASDWLRELHYQQLRLPLSFPPSSLSLAEYRRNHASCAKWDP